MIFTATALAGAWLLAPEPQEDERGSLARIFCRREFAARGLSPCVAQASVSVTRKRGTVRGLHWQAAPWEEAKLVRCTRGAIHDVIVDLRPGSPTRLRHVAVVLSAENRLMLYVPEGFAHGFQTLVDDTEMAYQMSQFHAPAFARGARWDDPALGLRWPETPPIVSERDGAWPDLVPSAVAEASWPR